MNIIYENYLMIYKKKCILESYKYGRIKNYIIVFDFVLLLLD